MYELFEILRISLSPSYITVAVFGTFFKILGQHAQIVLLLAFLLFWSERHLWV